MRWVVAGASGFLGQALCRALTSDEHQVDRLSLRDPDSADLSVLDGADVVVNLAGASIGRIPWTESHKRVIRDSRVRSTHTIASRLARRDDPPVFISQSAIGFYGSGRGDELLDEDSERGAGFLADVVNDWEAATEPASAADGRVVRLRTGVVFDRSGGAFRQLLLPFRLGLGGRLGPGTQYMGAVTLFDWIAAVRFVAEHPECDGVFNVVLPTPPTNAEFTAALGAALHRPTFLPVPASALRFALGGFSTELLDSRRIVPRRLLEAGFEFSAPNVEELVHDALHQL